MFRARVRTSRMPRLALAGLLAVVVAASATLLAQIPGRNVNMVAGLELAWRRPVPAAPERAVSGRVDAEPAAPRGRQQRLPHGRRPRAARRHRNGRCLGQRLQVVRRRAAVVEHADARVSAGHLGGRQRLPAQGLSGRRRSGGARRHARAHLLQRPGLRPRRERPQRHLPGAVHRPQQQGKRRPGGVPRREPGRGLLTARRFSTSRGWPSTCRAAMPPCAWSAAPPPAPRSSATGTGAATGKGKGRTRTTARSLDPGLQYVPAGAVYVAYTEITGEGSTLRSQIFVKRSMDCGATWSAPLRVTNSADALNQGATLSIVPATGDVFVAWRRFSLPPVTDADAVMVSRLRINGQSFDAPGKARGLRRTKADSEAVDRLFEHRKRRAKNPAVAASVSEIDQTTSPFKFRSNAYPGAGRGRGRAGLHRLVGARLRPRQPGPGLRRRAHPRRLDARRQELLGRRSWPTTRPSSAIS